MIGALAASVHGAVRASMHADVLLAVGSQRARELTHGDFEDPIPGLLKVSDSFGNRAGLLLGLTAMEPQAMSRVIEVPFQGSKLKFIGREDFMAMKVFAGYPVGLVDAARAISAGRDSLDFDLMHRLAKGYDRDASNSLERLLAR